jgi:fructose-bisphosphate aldolase, class I
LGERLSAYKKQGAHFTKWRAVLPITDKNPSRLSIQTNAEVLARYAAIAQSYEFIPIVEPEILIDGDHTIERCAQVTECVLHELFHALHRHHVLLEYVILKPSMVIAGKDCKQQASAEEVATQTFRILKRTVPAAVPSINFLSGGQTCEQASLHLHLMNDIAKAENNRPWNISFSYARALQSPAMKAWGGRIENIEAGQATFMKRAHLNSLASLGEYRKDLE